LEPRGGLMMKKIGLIILYLILFMFVIITIFPFIYMITTALTPDTYFLPYPPIIVPEGLYQ
jgi:multiple sugar transport system permease protein